MPAAYNAWQKHPPDIPGETEGQGNGPTSQPSGAGIPDRNGKERKSVLCERMLAVKEWSHTKAAYEPTAGSHNPLSR